MKFLFQGEESFGFFFFESGQGDSGHAADDFGDDLVVDDAVNFLGLGSPIGDHGVFFGFFGFDLIAEFGGAFVVGVFDGFVFFSAEAIDFAFDVVKIGRLGDGFEPDACAGFINDVDGFVGLDSAGDVSIAQSSTAWPRAPSVNWTR